MSQNYVSPRSGTPLLYSECGRFMGTAEERCSYPIIDDIPRFVASTNYAEAFGFQWNKFYATQLDSYSGVSISEDRLRRVLGFPLENLAGMKVLEAGSGSGRFTEILTKYGAILDTFDFSSACEANKKNHPHVNIAQADIREMPYADDYYDLVLCIGVIQHTPSPEESIERLFEKVAPGKSLIIDHYRFKFRNILPPPIGIGRNIYRPIIKRLAPKARWKIVEKLVHFWFPIHWSVRQSKTALRILRRVSPLHFYFHELPLQSKNQHFEWSLLDTHDGLTDFHKHYRSKKQLTKLLYSLDASEVVAYISPSDGVEVRATK
jgi:SAM-dependent methyltransferase